jgi:8-amino-7-oxononanoate synthase
MLNQNADIAVLIASPAIRQFLINYARPFIFSTAMSVNNVLAIESAFEILRSDEGNEVSSTDLCLSR